MSRKEWLIAGFIGMLGLTILSSSCSDTGKGEDLAQIIPDKIDFNFHIRPILSDRCYTCHGPDANTREAGLRLDLQEGAFAMLDSTDQRYAIVPGDLHASSLVERIRTSDPSVVMPPPESNLHLTDTEKILLEKWIEQGAEWKDHWAFIPPVKASPAEAKAQTHVIDAFVHQKLTENGLSPNPLASKEKQLRRLSFDLRGLPPSLAELDAFLADNRPQAYEEKVDEYLASEHFGERMALDWLDLARYADSHGYQDDLERSMWPWREWVIDAFNQNMPYDSFLTWQLAGDLLPNPTYEQQLATAFNRNHKITQEVGVIDEEYRVEYVLDRVNTVSTAFMGLTVACAQCHDHKYDPISQKEFYQLFSFFNQVPERGRVEYGVEVAEPSLPLPEKKVEQYTAFIKDLCQKQEANMTAYAEKAWANFEYQRRKEGHKKPLSGQVRYYPMDYTTDSFTVEDMMQEKVLLKGGPVLIPGRYAGGLEFTGKNKLVADRVRSLDFRKAFTYSGWLYNIDNGMRGHLLAPRKDLKVYRPGLTLRVTHDKQIEMVIRDKSGKHYFQVLSEETLPPDAWHHLMVSYDGSGKARGVQFYLDGEKWPTKVLKDALRGPIHDYHTLEMGRGMLAGRLDEVMLFYGALDQEDARKLFDHPNTPAPPNQDKARKRDFYHHLLHEDEDFRRMSSRMREYRIREGRMEDIILKPTMVMADQEDPRQTFILARGQYDAPTEAVEAGTPQAVLPYPTGYPQNRLGLAKWLTSPEHPLTARVAVNRFWQMLFGKGLVKSTEDFGSQGALPTHPALLDWLAVEFQENGWDQKALIKKIVLSETYRRSAVANPRMLELDPDNQWLARGVQVRLPAELIRDHALQISGLLHQQLGGPSVKPYQPAGLWLEIASGNQPLRSYIQDHEQDLYRKSLYTFWKRTSPPPSMLSFDAGTREQCQVKRQTTSTPMQALVLLNDPQFLEAARLLAVRMIQEGGDDLEQRIEYAFRWATSRKPSRAEQQSLQALWQAEKQDFEAHPETASQLLSIGENGLNPEVALEDWAAYAQIAHAIMNLSETLQKG